MFVIVATISDTIGHTNNFFLEYPMNKMGRPPKPDEIRKDAELRIRMTQEDRKLLDQVGGGKTSTWARNVLVKAANRKLQSGK